MKELSLHSMSHLLTMPYRRGAETLEIPIGGDADGWTSVAEYDFREYKARYQSDPPEPKYIILPLQNTGRDPLKVEFSFDGVTETTALTIPAQTFASTSFAIPLPQGTDATLRLQRFRQLPVALSGAGADNWRIIALLGNIAKLLWVLGWEKDQIYNHIQDVTAQRDRTFARSFSLDKLGEDLQVPRFPAREYSFDPDTLALYHLEEVIGDGGEVADETRRFGLAGHPGINRGANSGASGKFGRGFLFSGVGEIEIPTHPDFEVSSEGSFTVEAFVKAEANSQGRTAVAKGQQNEMGSLTGVGWSLSLGDFRGIANNVRWMVTDGEGVFAIFADVNLADGQFHHLAGTIDRVNQRSRIFVDGEERFNQDISELGAIANSEPIYIGRGFVGIIDEVRLSQVARTEFNPVLGESDAAYRQRLGIFERWLLPTPAALLQTINQFVRVIRREDDSFVFVDEPFTLIETDRPRAYGSQLIRILPAALSTGQSIDRLGNRRSQEQDISGNSEAEADFREIYLLRHDRSQVNYGDNENNRRLQVATKRALDGLLDGLAASGIAGNLIIDKSFDPNDQGLHRVGRSLLLRHETLSVEELAVYAYRAGFDFVQNRGTQVYASVAVGEKLEIMTESSTETPGIDVFNAQGINLHILPELRRSGQIRWTLIPCGAGRAEFEPHPEDDPDLPTPVKSRPRLRLMAEAPGEITVRVEYTYQRRTVTGTRMLRIGINNLAEGESIVATGDRNFTEAEAIDNLDEAINPIYLVTHDAPGVNYGGEENNRRMQIVLEKPLNRLLQRLTDFTGELVILKAYDPTDEGLHKAGRALRIQHTTLEAGELGALAHQVGFDFVRREGDEIYCSVGAGEKLEIVQVSDLATLNDEMSVGESVEVRPRFDALPDQGDYNWTTDEMGYGKGHFDFNLRSQVTFTASEPGFVQLNVTYLEAAGKGTLPYTFEVKLKPELDVPETIIPKDQYDLIMNILNYFHPIGVEVITQNLRDRVVEVESDVLRVFPKFTYPDYRF